MGGLGRRFSRGKHSLKESRGSHVSRLKGSVGRMGNGMRVLPLLVLQQPDVLPILVGHSSLLQLPGKVRVRLGPLLQALLLQLDPSIDLVQSLLDLLGYGRRCGYVIAGGSEPILIRRILHIHQGALRRLVGVLPVLDQHPIGIRVKVLEEARLLVNDAVARLVLRLVAAVLTLLLVVLDNGYPGAGLPMLLVPMVIGLVVTRNVVHILVLLVLLVRMVVLPLAGQDKESKEDL